MSLKELKEVQGVMIYFDDVANSFNALVQGADIKRSSLAALEKEIRKRVGGGYLAMTSSGRKVEVIEQVDNKIRLKGDRGPLPPPVLVRFEIAKAERVQE